ncbi:MAG: serine/threonine protein kinase [Planctomycetes bacterium]|nr:serine/threonine protein kinase [Planctomycetota bacterium]
MRRPLQEQAALDLLREAAAALEPQVIEIEERLAGPRGAAWIAEVSAGGGTEAAAALLAEALVEARRAVSSPAASRAADATTVELWGLLAASGHEPFAALGASALDAREPAHAAPLPEPERSGSIGRYELLEPLGAGASGVVFRARHRDHGGLAAVKLLRLDAQSPRQAERFRREARILSRLAHPAIVRVLDSGVALRDGLATPYLVSELVEGTAFDSALRGASRESVLRAFAEVCEAIAHAHERGVMHRDLKPANVLVDAALHAHVLDFGLAREESFDQEALRATGTGEVLGTLAAMSPEQARGERTDERSDVWALGALLFAALTGEAPHDLRERNTAECLRRIGEQPARRLRALRRDAERDLAAVVERALAFERDSRYRSATELLFDVRRLLAGDPVSARPPGFLEALTRFARRHRIASAVVLVVASVLAASAVMTLLALRQAQRSERATLEVLDRVVAYAENVSESSRPTRDQVRLLEESIASVGGIGSGVDQDSLRRIEARLWEILGDMRLRAGDEDGARAARLRVQELEEDRQRRGASNRLAFARALVKVGDLEKPAKPEVARGRYEAAHEIIAAEAARPDADLKPRDELGWSWERLADLAYSRLDAEPALELSEHRLRVAEKLFAEQPDGLRHYAMASALAVRAVCVERFLSADQRALDEVSLLLERACAHSLDAVLLAPERHAFLRLAMVVHQRRALSLLAEGAPARAEECILRPREWILAALGREPLVFDWRVCAIDIGTLLADCAEARANHVLAEERWEEAWQQAQAGLTILAGAATAREHAMTLVGAAMHAHEHRVPVSSGGPWRARRIALLEDAALASDATASECAMVAQAILGGELGAPPDRSRAIELARRAAALARRDLRPDQHPSIAEALTACGLDAEARAFAERMGFALDERPR